MVLCTFRRALEEDVETFMRFFWAQEEKEKEFWPRVKNEIETLLRVPGLDAQSLLNQDGEVVGVVMTAFLKANFVKILLEADFPDIIEKVNRNPSLISTDRELGKANASGHLVATVIMFGIHPSIQGSELAWVRNELMDRAVSNFRGFNLAEIMIEAHSEHVIDELTKSNFYVVNDYDKWWAENLGTRSNCPKLMTVTREIAREKEDFHILRMFVFGLPKFRFSYSERCLLDVAMRGLTDKEIADQLSLTPHAIKGRWRSIYAKASELFEENLDALSTSKRSREKRRRVLDYVRAYPEETRPYYR